jgi:hypothetical protein
VGIEEPIIQQEIMKSLNNQGNGKRKPEDRRGRNPWEETTEKGSMEN